MLHLTISVVAQFEILTWRAPSILWHDRDMPKRDFVQNALRVVEQAIGEKMDGTPLAADVGNEDQKVVRGRKGGLVGLYLSLLV
jgi:hypothetical protein